MDDKRIGEKEMKRPTFIYELLGKISDGTFLNEEQFHKLEHYISDLEQDILDCELCGHGKLEHLNVQHDDGLWFECSVEDCNCAKPRCY